MNAHRRLERPAGVPCPGHLADPRLDGQGCASDARSRLDFRGGLPDGSFWSIYARGTYQNMAVSRAPLLVGTARVVPVQALSGRRSTAAALRDGAYDLVVTATDIRGNSSSLTRRFTVKNGR